MFQAQVSLHPKGHGLAATTSAPGRGRTYNLQIRSLLLYPLSYWCMPSVGVTSMCWKSLDLNLRPRFASYSIFSTLMQLTVITSPLPHYSYGYLPDDTQVVTDF